MALLVAISEGNSWGWGSGPVIGLFALAVAALAVWVTFERGRHDPLVDMRIRERAVLTTNLTGFLIGFGMFGSFILIPQFVQMPAEAGFGFGATATEASLFMLPSAGIIRRRPARGLARWPLRLEAAARDRHRGCYGQLRLPSRLP